MNLEEDDTGVLTTKAIAAVRLHLARSPQVDQRLIFDIHQLAVTEFYQDEIESAYLHLKAVKALLPQIGGIQSIDASLREWVVIGDGYVAAELLLKPLYPASCFDPGSLASDDRVNPVPPAWPGTCLEEEQYAAIFPEEMRKIILDMTRDRAGAN